jgi:hypothetical protein
MKSLRCGSVCLPVYRIPNLKEVIGFYEIYYEKIAPRGHTKVVLFIFYYQEQNGCHTTWEVDRHCDHRNPVRDPEIVDDNMLLKKMLRNRQILASSFCFGNDN